MISLPLISLKHTGWMKGLTFACAAVVWSWINWIVARTHTRSAFMMNMRVCKLYASLYVCFVCFFAPFSQCKSGRNTQMKQRRTKKKNILNKCKQWKRECWKERIHVYFINSLIRIKRTLCLFSRCSCAAYILHSIATCRMQSNLLCLHCSP